MKAVILESYVMEEGDLDWSGVKALVPDTVSYVRTAYEEIAPRIGDADIVLLNKCRMDEELSLIHISSTALPEKPGRSVFTSARVSAARAALWAV